MNIDRVARAMVDVEPSADLEARIRARVREARPARTAARWVWRVGAPLAAAAVIALALVVQSPGSSVQGPGSRVQGPGSRVQAPIASAVPQVPRSPGPQVSSSSGPQVTRSAGPRVPRSPGPQLSAEELAWMERRMPALDPMNALQMDRLRVDTIQPEPLAITPLTMTPVGTDGAGIAR